MRISQRCCSVFFVLLLTASGCHTPGKYYDNEMHHGLYYSPYDTSGTITPWAQDAINQGVGRVVRNGYSQHPSNERGRSNSYPLNGVTPADARGSNAAVRLLGGWDYIAQSSDTLFQDVDALAIYIYQNNSNNDFYAQALAAAMVVYPELRARYYRAIRGNN